MRLSGRLKHIEGFLLHGHEIWDVCCDHGHLGGAQLFKLPTARVHFVDQVPHLIDKLQAFLKPRFGERAQFWSVPAEKIQRPISGTAVIAGVGGEKIQKIVLAWKENCILEAERLILAPHDREHKVRDLSLSGYYLKSETEVQEGRRTRKVFVFDRN